MALVTNYDLFQEFYNFIKDGATEEDVLKDFGGASLYVPSYKSIHRNNEIKKDYIKLKNDGKKLVAKTLAKKYDLSEAQILLITKELRQGGTRIKLL